MADQHYAYGLQHDHDHDQQQHVLNSEPRSYQVVKVASAVTAGGSLLLLSGLTLAGTVIALTIATPLLVIFSPVLVPALIAAALLFTGFAASGGFGVAAITALSWIYRFFYKFFFFKKKI